MSEQHTPGPWSVDEVDNDGEYGDGGPDSHVGFKSFCVIDEAGNVLFDSLNATIAQVEEDFDDDSGHHRAWDELAQQNLTLAAAAPDLLEALRGLDEAYCRADQPLTKSERHEDRMRLIAARAAIAKATGGAA